MPGRLAAWWLIAESRDFLLFDLDDDASAEWRRFRLVARRAQSKVMYHLAFNGDRLAMCHDAKALSERFPDAFEWVLVSLRGGCHVGQ